MTQLRSKNTTPSATPRRGGLILVCIAVLALIGAGVAVGIGLSEGDSVVIPHHAQVAVPTSGPGFSHSDERSAFLAFSQKLENECGAMPGSEQPDNKIPPTRSADIANYWISYYDAAPGVNNYEVAQIMVEGALSPRKIGEVYWNLGDPHHQLTTLTCHYGTQNG